MSPAPAPAHGPEPTHRLRWPANILIAGTPAGRSAGLCLATVSRPRAIAVAHLAWGLSLLPGLGRLVVGGPVASPVPPGLLADVVDTLGGPAPDGLAIYRQPQASRAGMGLLLLRGGRAIGFVKVRREPGALAGERAALERLRGAVGPVRCPVPLGSGVSGDWHWLATSALPGRPHRPHYPRTLDDLRTLTEAISTGLPGLGPTPGLGPAGPEGWRPMHGDLVPWNLRRCAGQAWLFDWEHAGFGPPGADLVYFAVVAAELGRPVSGFRTKDFPEATAFWLEHVAARPIQDHDNALNRRLVARLTGTS